MTPDTETNLKFRTVLVLVAVTLLGATGERAAETTWPDPVLLDVDVSGPLLQRSDTNPHDPSSIDRCGEPEIGQDPIHPLTLVVSCMSSAGLNYQTAQPSSFLTWSYTDVTRSGQWHQPCYVFVSRDGGQRWERVRPDPLNSEVVGGCSDPMVQAGPHGELYLGGDGAHYPVTGKYAPVISQPGPKPVPREPLGIVFTRSLDGGHTWSPPIIIPTANDRPWWTVDQSTGVLYNVSGCGSYDPVTKIGPYGCTPSSRNLAVSIDQGRTWEPKVDVFNTLPPTTVLTRGRLHDIGGGVIAAAQGVLATAGVQGGSADPDENHDSNTPGGTSYFKYSTDEGTTFTQRPLPLSGATGCPTPSVAGFAADPSHRGRFTVLITCSRVPRSLRVFVTGDLGAKWAEVATLAYVPAPDYRGTPSDFDVNRPWIAYGPTGALAVMWRQAYGTASTPPFASLQPGPQDVFVAIARDGQHFGEPLRVNRAASPPPDPRMFFGDDTSHVLVDAQHAYVVWGDWRSGELQTWFRKVPISVDAERN